MAYQLFLGYLMPKPFSEKNSRWEDKGVHTFPKGICPKVNVIARLEYELAYYDSAVHPFNHYTTRTPPKKAKWFSVFFPTEFIFHKYKHNTVWNWFIVNFVSIL